MLKNRKERRLTKIKTFLFFLLLATIFWMLTKYSNEYTQSIISKINYTNLPPDTTLDAQNISEISFDVVANGFEFLIFTIKKPTLNIDVSRYYSKENKVAVIPNNELKKLITNQLERNILVRNISVNNLQIYLNPLQSKKVKVVSNLEITFKPGYKSIKPYVVKPDSVLIKGPNKFIDTIQFLQTEKLVLQDVDENIEKQIALLNPLEKEITINPPQVNLKIPITETLQNTFEVPITVANVPNGVSFKILPETVSVTFTTTADTFKEITPASFTLTADYNARVKDENTIPVSVSKSPKNVFDLTIEPSRINFLILKQ